MTILSGTHHRANIRQVYFIEAEGAGMVKIGVANCAKTRMATLQKSSPVPLRLMGILDTDKVGSLEKELHRQFAAHRAHGEWFRADPDLTDWIASNAKEHRWPRRPTSTPTPDWLK